MSPGQLRDQLEAFHREQGVAELPAWGRPRLVPDPGLDREYADLFRPAAADGAAELSKGDEWRRRRWASFIAAGETRRRYLAERTALARRLARLRARESAPAGPEVDALAELAAAAIPERPAAPVTPPPAVLAAERRLDSLAGAGGEPEAGGPQQLAGDGPARIWRALTEEAGYLRRGDGRVRLAAGVETGVVACGLPDDVHLMTGPGNGMAAMERFLEAAGTALALAHLPRGLPPEDRWLPGDGGAAVYGRLWARLLHAPAWYAAAGLPGHLAGELARRARGRQARRLLELAELRPRADGAPPPPGWRWLADVPGGTAEPLARLFPRPSRQELLQRDHAAALLHGHLLRRFGHGWERRRRAADLLRQLWSEGWARPVRELLSFLGETDPDGHALVEELF